MPAEFFQLFPNWFIGSDSDEKRDYRSPSDPAHIRDTVKAIANDQKSQSYKKQDCAKFAELAILDL